jgi:hypothetical protein
MTDVLMSSRIDAWMDFILDFKIAFHQSIMKSVFQDGFPSVRHFNCTVQFLLSTAKGRCLWVQIRFSWSDYLSRQGGPDGRLVIHFGEHFDSRVGHFSPAETGRISGSFRIF